MLKVWTNGNDRIVAEGPEDADRVLNEQYGKGHGIELQWTALPDDRPLRINFEHGDVPASATAAERDCCQVTRTCARWAAINGRGLLCSTEY